MPLFLEFIADDENRVVLLDGGSDYMNASYIDVSSDNTTFEPCHEKKDLRVVRSKILQIRMSSHSKG